MKIHATPVHPIAILPLAILLGLLPVPAMAQQAPLTGQMMGGRHAAVAVSASVPVSTSTSVEPSPAATQATTPAHARYAAVPTIVQPMPTSSPQEVVGQADVSTTSASTMPAALEQPGIYAAQVGDTTQHLLRMQADGRHAGNSLPMLGDEASAGYRRYMKSFNHDIPEFYEATVGKDAGSAR